MNSYTTPGVYIRETEAAPLAGLRLDITGFVGQAERGPLNYPQAITSWGQFQDIFGDFVGFSYLSYVVFGFLLNGGERCYIVRVAHETATRASLQLLAQDGTPAIGVEAINEGGWATAVMVTVAAQWTGQGFKLIVRYQPGGRLIREEIFDNLSLNATDDRYFVRVINGDPEEKDYVKRIRNGNSILIRVHDLRQSVSTVAPVQEATNRPLAAGSDGPLKLDARYYTGRESGSYFHPLPPGIDENRSREIAEQLFGLAVFETISEIGLVAIPDLIIPDLYAMIPESQIPSQGIIFASLPSNPQQPNNLEAGQLELLKHCETMGDRFAILDAPRGLETGKIENWPDHFQIFPNAKYGALYYPWLKEKTIDFGGRELFIPPCGHVAGIYARTEQERGIGKAPANEVLQGVVELEFQLSTTEQDILNPRGVNCLRIFPGRGLRVWGARTLSLDPLWRYVNVRRVYLAIVKQILVNLQWTVFEPNDQRLWARIVAILTLFFRDLLQRGVLAGQTPEQAFFVKCDEQTNPPEGVERGEVIVQVGFAPAQPAEFVLLTIRRTAESLSVSEQA